MTILAREGTDPKYRWLQYMVVTDHRVAVIEMIPALFGWNLGKVTIQTGKDYWGDMTEAQIVAWKLQTDEYARIVNDDLNGFRARLLQAIGLEAK